MAGHHRSGAPSGLPRGTRAASSQRLATPAALASRRDGTAQRDKPLLLLLSLVLIVVSVAVAYEATASISSSDRRREIEQADSKPEAVSPLNERDTNLQARMDSIAEDMAAEFDAQIGIALLGDHGPMHAGRLDNRAAWSTLKVPIAAAAWEKAELEQDPDLGYLRENTDAAIENSDNQAALNLWYFLGDDSDELAAERLSAYLTRGGDSTQVPTEFEQGVFEGFGDTLWRATDQVRFLTNFQCEPGAQPVLESMGRINPEHMVGLGTVPGALFKGGWGLGYDDLYVYRQMGLVPAGPEGAMVPVAVIVIPNDASQDTAIATIDATMRQLTPVLVKATPARPCL